MIDKQLSLTAEDVAEIAKKMKDEADKQEAKERQKTESIEIKVGNCPICAGDILYRSVFVPAIPMHEIRFGPYNNTPLKEIKYCRCGSCNIKFGEELPRYREIVEQYRNRE